MLFVVVAMSAIVEVPLCSPKIQAVKLYYHLFMQTLIKLESARANIFTVATKTYLFTLKGRQKMKYPETLIVINNVDIFV